MNKPRLAVTGIINKAGKEYTHVVDGLSELITDIFIRSNKYVIISPESISKIDTDQRDRIYRELNVEFIISGQLQIIEVDIVFTVNINKETSTLPVFHEEIKIPLIKLIQLSSKLQSVLEEYLRLDSNIPNPISRLPENLEIRRTYELGNLYLNKHDPSYAELALHQFQKVIDKEPDFLPAYIGYAETAIFLVGRGYHKASVLYPKVLEFLNTMIRFKPDYGELYISKGIIDFFYSLNWDSTYKNIEKGLKMYSEASKSYLQLSFFWYGMKNYEKALECIDIALEYNPLSVSLLNMKSDIYLSARDFKKARESYLSILEIKPDDKVAFEYLMFISLLENNERQAKYYKNKLVNGNDEDPINYPRLLYYYGKMSLTSEWQEAKQQIDSLDTDVTKLGRLAMLYAGVQDKDKLMYFAEKAFNARTGILFILTDPIFDIIRNKSRYKALEAQINFPENISDEEILTIQSDLKETLEININSFLYAMAQEKYVIVYYYNHFRVQKSMLRVTLNSLSKQLPQDSIWQCHRSYIVNKNLNFKSSGNSRGYVLYNSKYDFEVPVSRAKIEEMKALYNF